MYTHVPLRSILLATNLADIQWLFPYTCSLAEESGASVTLLHVITALNGFSVDLAGVPFYRPDEAIAAAKAQMREACCQPCAAKVHSQVMSMDGSPADGILATAKEIHADLLVMGTRGYRGLDKWLHGSVAEEVLRCSPVPTVTVGPRARRVAAEGKPVKSIVFATSLKARVTEAINVNLIYKWIERLHGHLTLLHVAPDEHKHKLTQEENRQAREHELHALLPEEAFRNGTVDAQVRLGRTSHEILAASAHADLIALGALRNPGLGRLASGGTLFQVLAEAHCPVATLHSEHQKGWHA